VLWVEGATYIYLPIEGFAKVEVVMMLYVEGVTYIYWPINGSAKVEFV
jgi:hypothetical protein